MQQYNIAAGITKPANMGNEHIGTEVGAWAHRTSPFCISPDIPLSMEIDVGRFPCNQRFALFLQSRLIQHSPPIRPANCRERTYYAKHCVSEGTMECVAPALTKLTTGVLLF